VTLRASKTWYLLQSGSGAPAWNMAMDEALLEAAPTLGHTVLRFYSWTEPAASFGYFQKYAEVERATLLRPLVRRPTAGGIVPHDADWTYSLIFPPNEPWYSRTATDSYQQIHLWLQAAFARIGVVTELAPSRRMVAQGQCFEGYEQCDLLWQGRKIAGAAQRRNRCGLLIQGSVQPPLLHLAKADWQKALCDAAYFGFGVNWENFETTGELRERAEGLARQKYSQPAYLRKR
jgi:lipoyl(octanoyl) transferase